VQIALGMAAYQLAIAGEGDVALHNASAHARRRHVGFPRVLGELQRRAAMADREVSPVKRPVDALLQGRLELALVHILDEEEGARAKLHAGIIFRTLRARRTVDRERPGNRQRDYQGRAQDTEQKVPVFIGHDALPFKRLFG